MKKIYETEEFVVSETGHDCDFVAVIENKTNKTITTGDEENSDILEPFDIKPNEWVGLTDMEYLKLKVYLGLETRDLLEEAILKSCE